MFPLFFLFCTTGLCAIGAQGLDCADPHSDFCVAIEVPTGLSLQLLLISLIATIANAARTISAKNYFHPRLAFLRLTAISTTATILFGFFFHCIVFF